MLAINKPIVGAKQVQAQVLETTGLTVVPSLTRQVMRKDLCMGYRRAKIVTIQNNSERCLVQRQQFALILLPLLESGKRIINVDESWLNQSRFVRKLWVPSDAAATYTDKQVAPRISLLVALDSDGRMWTSLT